MADFLDETPSTDDSTRCERAFLVGVQTPEMAEGEAAELMAELQELVENLRIGVVGTELVNLRRPTPATLLGSGKTEELIRRIKRAQIARQKVQIFKPEIDTRYASEQVASHSELRLDARNIRNAEEIMSMLEDNTRVVGIDEAQFFSPVIVEI